MKAIKTPKQTLLKKASSKPSTRKIYNTYDEALDAAKQVGGIVGLVGPKGSGPLYNSKDGFIVVGVKK